MAENQIAALGPDGFGAHPRTQQPGEVPEREPVRMPGRHHQRIRTVAPDVLLATAGVGPGQRAKHQPPRHEAGFGVGFAGPDQGVHLIEEAVVAALLGDRSRPREPTPIVRRAPR